ncbi:MAG: DegQ family serine endoprotease [Burkholderiales bacterium]|nr:DegQ family serine endoprotease [Burkholderiales bacterium]
MIRHFFYAVFCLVSTAAGAQNLPDFTGIVAKEGAAVVNISTTHVVHDNGMVPGMPNLSPDDPFYQFFRHFGPQAAPRDYETRSLGSGFIISSDGYILTNAHVVDSADEVLVKLNDKRQFKAKVIGEDKRSDVALIKIQAQNLPLVKRGDPIKLKVGEWVVAIGSPFGFDNTVTAGIVSAKGRALPQEDYVPFIQTDVAINPGNSGGPLFNMNGEVVGINSQIYSRTGGFMGLSFAIPIDVAMNVADQLRSSGHVTRGKLGVVIQGVSRELAASFGLAEPRGALVSNVAKDSAAAKAGLQPSDIILKFNGKAINESKDLPKIVASTKPGSKVMVELWRKGVSINVPLVVDEMPADKVADAPQTERKSDRLGLYLSALNPEQKKQIQSEHGLLVESVEDGPAIQAGIRRGDVILALNDQDIDSVEQFEKLLAKVHKGRDVALLVWRGGSSIFVTMKVDGK